MTQTFEADIKQHFAMKDLGNLRCYVGMQIEQDSSDGLYMLHQKSYIEKKLREFNLHDSKPSSIPVDPAYLKQPESSEKMDNTEIYRKAIGSLMYLAVNTRPDIAVGTSILARRVEEHRQADWTEFKRIFRYLNGTKDRKLKLGNKSVQNNSLIGYADADWAGDSADRKSNTGFVFKYLGAPIAWCSRKQNLVTLSSTEAEYIALSETVKEAIWMNRILKDFYQTVSDSVTIYEDNQSCIKLIQDEKSCQRTKHIDTKFHFIRELYKSGTIDIKYCPTSDMPADLLTKPLESVKLKRLMQIIGII